MAVSVAATGLRALLPLLRAPLLLLVLGASLALLTWLSPAPPPAVNGDSVLARQLTGSLRMARPVDGAPAGGEHLGYFLRSVDLGGSQGVVAGSAQLPLCSEDLAALEGVSHYRLLPGSFPEGMRYHFDGLATVLQFNFSAGRVAYAARAFQSRAAQDFGSCIFFGTGSGPTLGYRPCITNPAVNLLPIEGQLWLTIDTSRWGRVDPGSLETLPGTVQVPSTVLNAHPACDPHTRECYVQYNCGSSMIPYTDQACIALLRPQPGGLVTQELSRATLPKRKLIQHSHSPCVTPHYVVSKLDAFIGRSPVGANSGLLKLLRQDEDNLWMVMDRRTNISRVMTSTASFVNNHFWNCFQEDSDGDIIVDAVAATEDYLDNYFEHSLNSQLLNWTVLFHPPVRCRIPPSGSAISCEAFFQPDAPHQPLFDYPTFNPNFKMNPNYKFFYAIAAKSPTSRWFDQLIKVDAQSRSVLQSWSAPGVYLTEADFIPRHRQQTAADATVVDGVAEQVQAEQEDEGLLVSVLYNATSDASALALFDAKGLDLLGLVPLGFVVPFHAHGVVCQDSGRRCYPNP